MAPAEGGAGASVAGGTCWALTCHRAVPPSRMRKAPTAVIPSRRDARAHRQRAAGGRGGVMVPGIVAAAAEALASKILGSLAVRFSVGAAREWLRVRWGVLPSQVVNPAPAASRPHVPRALLPGDVPGKVDRGESTPSAAIGLEPSGLVRGMRALGLPGIVWLDDATNLPAGRSLLAACPEERWRGEDDGDWSVFTRELARFEAAQPGGAVLGWVEYGGAFEFAGFRRPVCCEAGRWRAPGGQPSWWEEARCAAASGGDASGSVHLRFSASPGKEEFCRRVRRAQEHIAAGDIYQVNLSRRFEAAWPDGADALALYLKLRQVSPAPEAAFLDFPDRTVLCASPESFLCFQSDRRVRTRPIKGTRPRFPDDPARDAASAQELLASEKECAELLMITDLLRHDLGQVCEFGSVRVPELRRLERFAQVFHLISTVEGRLRPGVSPAEALRACLPGGSITGAPKRRACEVIADLEAPVPRGLYTGTIGGFGAAALGGGGRFNIAIRTLIVERGSAHFHVGAGIVADSVPALEFEETLHKATGLLRACGDLQRGSPDST